jgi:hypothetical protein
VHGLYQHADVMAEHLAEHFVYLPRIALGAQGASELALYHGVGCLDVASLVVVLHEGIPLVHEQVVHLRPRPGLSRLKGVGLERDEGHPAKRLNSL